MDLTHAVEACDFAAGLLAVVGARAAGASGSGSAPRPPSRRALLPAHGLELVDEEDGRVALPSLPFPLRLAFRHRVALPRCSPRVDARRRSSGPALPRRCGAGADRYSGGMDLGLGARSRW